MDVRMPDGTIVTNVPDNITQAELLSRYQSSQSNPDANLGGTLQFGNPFTGSRFDTGLKIPPEVEAGLVAAGKGTQRLIQGVRQMLPGDNAKLDAQVAEENARYAPLAEKHPIATTVGEMGPYMATASPLAMGLLAATEYGSPQERAARGGLAFAGGKVGEKLGRLFGPKSMSPEADTLGSQFFADAPNKWGIPLTVGQATGSKPAQLAESVLANLPFGGAVNKARDQSFGAFNKAITKTFGEDSSQITPELLGGARERIGQTIGDLANRNTLTLDQGLAKDIARVSQRATSELTGPEAELVNKQISQIIDKIDPNTGTMPGTLYKAYDSMLGKMAKNNRGTIQDVLGDLRESLRSAMDRSISPPDSAAWKTARGQYFNVNQVANAAKSTPGELSPAQLLQSVNNAQRSSRFGGGNELADLARFGKQTLPDKIPNSGTAQRLFMQKLLTNPVSAGTGLLGLGYGANQLGADIPASAGTAVALPLLMARLLAGKPSPLATSLLTRGGGLLGVELGR